MLLANVSKEVFWPSWQLMSTKKRSENPKIPEIAYILIQTPKIYPAEAAES